MASKKESKKSVAKKATAKKAAAKKTVSKKSAPKKAVAKKTVSKKSAPKKAVAKKTASKKSIPKKAVAKKTVSKKSAPKKTVAKKPVIKQTPAKEKATTPMASTTASPAFQSIQAEQKTNGNKRPLVLFLVAAIIAVVLIIVYVANNESVQNKVEEPANTSATENEMKEQEVVKDELAVTIRNLKENDRVKKYTTIKGSLKGLPEDTHFWVTVKPGKSVTFYPQKKEVVPGKDGSFKALIHINGKKGDRFDVHFVVANASGHQFFKKYIERGEKTGSYPEAPLPEGARSIKSLTIVLGE